MKQLFILLASQILISSQAIADTSCELPLIAAKALARLYILDNQVEILKWVHFKDANEYSKQVVLDYSFSPYGHAAGYSFPITSYKNGNLDQFAEAWLQVSCDGTTNFLEQFRD